MLALEAGKKTIFAAATTVTAACALQPGLLPVPLQVLASWEPEIGIQHKDKYKSWEQAVCGGLVPSAGGLDNERD